METVKKYRLVGSRLTGAEFGNTVHLASPDGGTPFERVIEPGYWALVAKDIKERDEIKVIPDDYSFFAHLLVTKIQKMDVYVKVLMHKVLDETVSGPDEESDFEIKWAGPNAKFRVVRKSDNQVLQEHIQSKEDAVKWLAGYERSLAA